MTTTRKIWRSWSDKSIKLSTREYRNSIKLSEEETSLIKKQQHIYKIYKQKEKIIKENIKSDKSKEYEEQKNNIEPQMEEGQQKKVKLKLLMLLKNPQHTIGLQSYPFKSMTFILTKVTFWICVPCKIPLKHIPFRCVCGAVFDIEYVLSWEKGGYYYLRKNEVRDFALQVFFWFLWRITVLFLIYINS